jgi:hypothetical protein
MKPCIREPAKLQHLPSVGPHGRIDCRSSICLKRSSEVGIEKKRHSVFFSHVVFNIWYNSCIATSFLDSNALILKQVANITQYSKLKEISITWCRWQIMRCLELSSPSKPEGMWARRIQDCQICIDENYLHGNWGTKNSLRRGLFVHRGTHHDMLPISTPRTRKIGVNCYTLSDTYTSSYDTTAALDYVWYLQQQKNKKISSDMQCR